MWLYSRNTVREIYISDFSNISAQIELYRRSSNYISDFPIISTCRHKTTKEAVPKQPLSFHLFRSSTRTVVPSPSYYTPKRFHDAVQQSSAQSTILNRYLLRFSSLLYLLCKTVKIRSISSFSIPIPLSDIEIMTLDSNSSTKNSIVPPSFENLMLFVKMLLQT